MFSPDPESLKSSPSGSLEALVAKCVKQKKGGSGDHLWSFGKTGITEVGKDEEVI